MQSGAVGCQKVRAVAVVGVGEIVVFPLVDRDDVADRKHVQIRIDAVVRVRLKARIEKQKGHVDGLPGSQFEAREGAAEDFLHILHVFLPVVLPHPHVMISRVIDDVTFGLDEERHTFVGGRQGLHMDLCAAPQSDILGCIILYTSNIRHVRFCDLKALANAGGEVDIFAYDVMYMWQDPPELPYAFAVVIAVIMAGENHRIFRWIQLREGAPVVARLEDVPACDRCDHIK